MKKCTTNLPFLDIMINKMDTNILMDMYNKSTDLKGCIPFSSNHSRSCLRNIPFCLVSRICTIAEEEKIKLKQVSELKISLTMSPWTTIVCFCVVNVNDEHTKPRFKRKLRGHI